MPHHEPMDEKKFREHLKWWALREFFNPPRRWLAEFGVKAGDAVLDFGCGRGGFTLAAAKLAGPGGKVYALDRLPLALATVEKRARRRRLKNVFTIPSEGPTGLADETVDVVLLYDVFHELDRPEEVLAELARVMKPGGTLSFSDHHLQDDEVRARVGAAAASGAFEFLARGRNTFTFRKKT